MVNFFINLAAVVFKIELRNITFINCHHLLHLCYLEREKKVYFTVGLYFLDLLQIVIAESLGAGLILIRSIPIHLQCLIC